MKELKFKKIDAFTGKTSSGNPAGCIDMRDTVLTPGEMQAIAGELKGFVSETVFIFPAEPYGGEIIFPLKYYSSECEVEFCGHATVACMYDIIKNDKRLIDMSYVGIRTSGSELKVYNDIHNSDSVFITSPVPSYPGIAVSCGDVCRSLNLPEDHMSGNYNTDVINAGLCTLIVPVKNLETCLNINPGFTALRNFCENNEIDIVLVFTDEVSGTECSFRTRVFAPRFGYLEDPATGSGNAAFGCYLLKNSIWNGGLLSIEQGPDRNNPNIVKLKTVMDDNMNRVLFGGAASVKIDGKYYLNF